MSVTCLCRSVVVSVNIFCLSVFVCELNFGQLSVGELSHNVCFLPPIEQKIPAIQKLDSQDLYFAEII